MEQFKIRNLEINQDSSKELLTLQPIIYDPTSNRNECTTRNTQMGVQGGSQEKEYVSEFAKKWYQANKSRENSKVKNDRETVSPINSIKPR